MTTLRDVAQEAGVSTMTVSNVVNGRLSKVSPATVERVLAIVEQLGYVPNRQARALAAKSSGIIALIFPHSPSIAGALSNQHDSTFIGAVETRVTGAGRFLMLHSAAAIMDAAESLSSWNIDGAIFLGSVGHEVDQLLGRFDLPMVFVDNYSDVDGLVNVGVDDFGGGRMAGRYLVDAGHRRLGFVGPVIHPEGVVRQRYEGFVDGLASLGVDLSTDRVLQCDPAFEQAVALGTALAADPGRATAYFVTADIIGIGLIKGLTAAGVRIPEEVSIVGFDDLPACEYTTPGLTTVRQEVAAKGEAAVDLMLEMMAGERPADRRILLDVSLIERGTVGPPPA